LLSLIYRKLANYEYALSNFYKKISSRNDEYSNFFNQLAIEEKKHCKMLYSLLDKREEIIPSKYLVESIQYKNEKKKVNNKLSIRNPLFYIIFRGKSASSYSTRDLLKFVQNGEKIAYLYYSLLLWVVKCLTYITNDSLYKLDIKIISTIREDEKIHSQLIH